MTTYNNYYGLSKTLNTIDSSNANRFKQQITIDQIMMEVEISYLKHFTYLLKELI